MNKKSFEETTRKKSTRAFSVTTIKSDIIWSYVISVLGVTVVALFFKFIYVNRARVVCPVLRVFLFHQIHFYVSGCALQCIMDIVSMTNNNILLCVLVASCRLIDAIKMMVKEVCKL